MPQANQSGDKSETNPELRLALCCVHAKTPENEPKIRALLSSDLNWVEFIGRARQHHLLPVVCKRLLELDASCLTLERRESLVEIEREAGKSNLFLLGEMLKLFRIFEAAGIPAIPFKGPVLALIAYQSFTLRTFADLDFVVPQSHIPNLVSLLESTGYKPQFKPAEAQAGEHGYAPGQYAFRSGKTRTLVEIHTERTLRYFPRTLNLNEMNARLIPVKIGGQTVRTFSLEDNLVMLCVHGAKHFWERLSWIVDLAYLIGTQPMDWQAALRTAAEMRCTRLLLCGIYLAHELCGTSLPPHVLDTAQRDANVLWLARRASEQFEGIADSSAGVLPRIGFRLRSRDGIAQGLRHVLRLAIEPTESDREILILPRALSPFYMLVRPWRLLRDYGLRKHQPQTDLAYFEPTPPEAVGQMLQFAKISPNDVLYDLGCGDGRIVVEAARKFGIRAVGVDIDPRRIAEAEANARKQGVEDRVRFQLTDAKDVDVSEATIVTLFLFPDGVLSLVEKLRSQLQAGARIVSRGAQVYGWIPDRMERHVLPNGIRTHLYLWTIKKAEGESPVAASATPGAP